MTTDPTEKAAYPAAAIAASAPTWRRYTPLHDAGASSTRAARKVISASSGTVSRPFGP
ncbi:hypothetical protein SBI_00399 [Streptomyces bingchenggensis BCW-1]|uniref:Uncharacterized protein n=1 Tax=Streptomyces bingchenggensis (strain BCW-1) TaxID=749414 RepID=D7BYJ2_STRBB|nr:MULTISPECIES: hypothetical protein [Streptomyces]ADI03520.1 hypothetical protein SBI_00399 [Streptomyces bingchenggensis BCW-1]